VEFRYQPDSFRYGVFIALGTLAASLAILVLSLWFRRRHAPPGESVRPASEGA
jgi:hypothetical protein